MKQPFTSFKLQQVASAGLVLCLLFGVFGTPAQAGGNPISPDKYPDFRKALLTGDKGTRKGTLMAMLNAPRDSHPEIYGRVFGPIFSDKANTQAMGEEKRRALFAALIAHLADIQPTDDNILLAEQFLPLLAADAKLVTVLREEGALGKDPSTHRQPGWERILKRAQVLLGQSKDPLVRRAAIHLSATCDCAKAAEAVAALYDALKAGGAATPEDAAAYLDAAGILLQKRFENTGRLLTFLEPFAPQFEQFKQLGKWPLAASYRIRAELLSGVLELMKAKGGQRTSEARQSALAYGSELIQLIAKSGKPEDLVVFFQPGRERYEELQRKALKAARANLKPQANQGWATLLDRALSHSDDPQVLADVITVLSSTFTKRTKDSELLAAAIARRIQRRPAADSVQHRKDLADRLGFVGALADVRAALPANLLRTNGEQKAVYEALIRDIGLVKNGLVAALKPYYLKDGAERPPEWARLAVAESLGYQGLSENGHQGRFAALMLRHILTGTPVTDAHNKHAGIAEKKDYLLLAEANPEDAPAVREVALRSLASYPGAATAEVLREVAASDPDVAATALRILGRQLGRGSKDAALALGKLIEEGLPEKRLLETLKVIATNKAPTGAAERKALAAQVRVSLAGSADTSDALRARAAAVAAHLGDAKAVKPAYVVWKDLKDEKARARWHDLLRAIVVAAAKMGAEDVASTRVLHDQLRKMAGDGHRDAVLGFFAAMGPEANRFVLKRLRADLHFERPSTVEGRSREENRKDMDRALALYRALVKESKGADQQDVRRSLYRVLTEGLNQALLAEGEHLDPFYLQAFQVAAESRSPLLAREALQSLSPALEKSQVLNEQQKSLVARLKKTLQALAAK